MGKGKKPDKEKDFDNQFQERNSNLPYFFTYLFLLDVFCGGKTCFSQKEVLILWGK